MATLKSLYSRSGGNISLSVTTGFTIPAELGTQTQAFDSVEWAAVGLTVHFSDGTNYGLFTVTNVSGSTLTLKNTWGQTNGTTIAIGGELIPAAPPGPAGTPGTSSSANGIVFTESIAPTTAADEGAIYVNASNQLAFRSESNGTIETVVLSDTYALGTELIPTQSTHSGKFLTTDGTVASWAVVPGVLPAQTGENGKFLTTDGSVASWAVVPGVLPTQTGNDGKFLQTDGTTASWESMPSELPSVSGESGKFLTNNGTVVSWAVVPGVLPTQTGNNGKFLKTDGTTATWELVPATLPTQVGQSGKFLTTDGTDASWTALIASNQLLPSQSGQNGKYLATDGSSASWTTLPSDLPSQGGNDGRFLTTSGVFAYWADVTATVDLNTARTYTKAQRVATVTLSDAATINVDANAGNVFYFLLGGNRTLANPTNLVNGQTLVFVIKQDGTGNRTLAYGANYKFPGGTTPTLSTAASATDVLYCVAANNLLYCNLVKAFA